MEVQTGGRQPRFLRFEVEGTACRILENDQDPPTISSNKNTAAVDQAKRGLCQRQKATDSRNEEIQKEDSFRGMEAI